jgi:hypothetical protein
LDLDDDGELEEEEEVNEDHNKTIISENIKQNEAEQERELTENELEKIEHMA